MFVALPVRSWLRYTEDKIGSHEAAGRNTEQCEAIIRIELNTAPLISGGVGPSLCSLQVLALPGSAEMSALPDRSRPRLHGSPEWLPVCTH